MKIAIKIKKSSWGPYWYTPLVGKTIIVEEDEENNTLKYHAHIDDLDKECKDLIIDPNFVAGWVVADDIEKV